MPLSDWINKRLTRLQSLDFGLLKICIIAFTLMVAKLWPPLLTPDWKIFAGIFLVTYVPLAVKLLIKKDGHA